MSNKIIRTLWGDLQGEELKKFALLALGFFFLIGSYWPLKILKDSIFINIVGRTYIPTAKLLSLTLFFPLVLGYSKLVDYASKEKIVYFLISIYGTLGVVFVWYFLHPTIGLSNTITAPNRYIGWLFFLFVESYISLMVSLYWSFVNDVTTPESAKKGYGMIVFGAQFGGFSCILLANRLAADTTLYAQRVPLIASISIAMFFAIAFVTFLLQKTVDKENLTSYEEKISGNQDKKESVGFLDGLKVIVTRPYVGGIFLIIFFHELISTVMNYQMLFLVETTYLDPGSRTKFLFDYGLYAQSIACLFGLVGTSFFQRRFGIKFCIIAFPVLLGSSIVVYLLNPTLQAVFYVMLIAKGINYAFNQPAKEVLYIPTSKNIKYKSKAWADMFGFRFAKATASIINRSFGPFVYVIGGISLSIISIWVMLSNALGNKFRKTVLNKEIIE